MEDDKTPLESTEGNKPYTAVTEHVMDDLPTMLSRDTFSMAETLDELSISTADPVSFGSNEGERDRQKHILSSDKVSVMEDCKVPCLEVEGPALIEPRQMQDSAPISTSNIGSAIASAVIGAVNLSIESKTCEKDDRQCNNAAGDKDFLQGHCVDGNNIIHEAIGDEDCSHIACTDDEGVHKPGVEKDNVACGVLGDDELNSFAFEGTSTNAEIIGRQHPISNGNKSEVEQQSCVVPLSSIEDNKVTCNDLPCCDAIPNLEKMSSVHTESDMHGNFDDSIRFANENYEAGYSCQPTVAIQVEDAKRDIVAVSQNKRPSLNSSDSSDDPNAFSSEDNEDHVIASGMSGRFFNTEDKGLSTAQVTDSGDLVTQQDICDNIPEEVSMELQCTAIHVKLDNDSTSGTLKDLTCALDTLKISHVGHTESSGDKECLMAVRRDLSMPASPLIICSVAEGRDIDGNNTHLQCSEGNHSVVMDFGIGATEEGTASNKSQLHGYTVDKDGGSSMDSTAGTEWKPQETDGCIAAEEEEIYNTGAEDSASNIAYLQPSTQQRKKININHQFVREIVKIQHDREQYDREQSERQNQAQQAAVSAQLVGRHADSKGRKVHSSDSKQIRNDLSKVSSQKGPKDHGDDRQTDSQQKHATRVGKPLSVQAKEVSSYQKNALKGISEHERQGLLGTKEYGKSGRGRQQRSMSIYRPPVIRDSLMARESETSHHQSGTYAINSSPDSSASSVSDFHVPIVDSPGRFDVEEKVKIAGSSSGESYAHNAEVQSEQGKSGMGIKVTFDTERKLRHIEFSDSARGHRQDDQVSLAATHSNSGIGISKSTMINPLLSHPSQEYKSSFLDKRQAGLGEAPSRANERYITQADRNSSLQGFSPSESTQFRGRTGRTSGNIVERKNNFFEQADNSVILPNSSTWLQSSPSFTHHGGQSIYGDSVRHAETHFGHMRTSNLLLQGFNTPNSHKSSALGPSNKGEFPSASSYLSPYMGHDESNLTPSSSQPSMQAQQSNVTRSKHDLKGKQKLATLSDGREKRRDSQSRNSIRESGSPFQAMMKDTNRSQAMYSSPAPQSSGNSSSDIQGFGMSWDMEDHVHCHNQDSPQEGLKRTQSDGSRKGSAQNLQAQSSLVPGRDSFFSAMPMQEKWGDIVDDQYDPYDYLQGRREVERENRSGNLFYGNNFQSIAAFVDTASLKPERQTLKQNKTPRSYGHSETGSMQRNKATAEMLQDHSIYESPARKSVFERLGPQNNFKESILGPPPKMLDSRGVLRASPDIIRSNAPPASTFKSFDTGFHGVSQQAAHLSGMLHETGDNFNDEGREVVVQAYTEVKQRRSKRELYVPRRGS